MASNPRAVVEELFDRMADEECRETVGELFAEDAVIQFPGERFEGADAAEEMLTWLDAQYEWARKEFDRWIVTGSDVVCLGTLYGIDSGGQSFEDVRYVDVYEVVDARIERMDIYNDLALGGIAE
ncbi:nuclear transport factor 2 family protein [Halomarina ordinaria]|uniref:Nuclear transport factor 2 family protein n=1 Tax=Halomarina ordinaria TaxID=3033939 RepID=A0ABD5UG86_9EURY|nr:nuclear transport factor 2 family protein [Halomarina sp. PSRA2]